MATCAWPNSRHFVSRHFLSRHVLWNDDTHTQIYTNPEQSRHYCRRATAAPVAYRFSPDILPRPFTTTTRAAPSMQPLPSAVTSPSPPTATPPLPATGPTSPQRADATSTLVARSDSASATPNLTHRQHRRGRTPSWNRWGPSHTTTGAQNRESMCTMLPRAPCSKAARQPYAPNSWTTSLHTCDIFRRDSRTGHQSAHRHDRHWSAAFCAQTDQTTGSHHYQTKRPCGSFAQREARPHLRPHAHEALGHAAMSILHTLPPRHSKNTMPPRTALLVDRHERQHTLLDTQLPQVRRSKTSRHTVSWPIISIPLPTGPGIAVSVDYFGPLPTTHATMPTSYSSLTASAAEPTCTPSLQPTTQRKVPRTFLLTA